jgi:HK97 family phage major capsid protein
MSRVAEYTKSMQESLDKANAIREIVDRDQGGEPTDEQYEQIKSHNKDAEGYLKSLQKAQGWETETKTIQRGRDFLKEPVNQFQYGKGGAEGGGNAPAAKSMAEQFMASEQWQGFLKTYAPDGRFPERTRLQSSPVTFTEGVKTLITGDSVTSAGALFRNDRKPLIDPGVFARPLRMRDLVTVGTTTGDTVEYVREGLHTNNAAPVAEATATGGSSGVKPESAMLLEVVTEPVKTIATWLPATRRALADAGQLRTIIERLLRYMLAEELDDQIITGSGVGENFTGIANVPGTQTQAWDTDILTTTRKAKTLIALNGRARATGYVLHPTEVESLDLLTDNEERYYYGGPSAGGVAFLWGLPVVETEATPAGTGYVGQWDLLYLWDRELTNILVSDSHSDFFVRNLIAVLAELRAALGCIRPKAFAEIDTQA